MTSVAVQKFFVIGGLFLAAGFMVMAWIAHLKFNPTFIVALFISLGFVIPEYLLNTYITRYSDHKNLFNPGQLAIISIVSGLFFTFIINTFMFDVKPDWKDFVGFILVGFGGYLTLDSPQKPQQAKKNLKKALKNL